MEVLQVTATQFLQPMKTGRNRPLLLGCEDGVGKKFEVVVKFRGQQMSEQAQTAELIAAQLADDLGLQVPQAAVVDVPTGFEAVVLMPEEAEIVKRSSGPNFGSVHIGPGFTTWLPGRSPYGAQRDQAAEVFAFDTLVQNPDRRPITPNLWVKSDRIGVYDHEQAFSFLYLQIIGAAPRPWSTASQGKDFGFLEQHIFYRSLRGSRLNLGLFAEKLRVLADEQLEKYVESVPTEWSEGRKLAGTVAGYLREARKERETLINFVKHLLR
jgi:hypothetical protein